MLLRSVSRPGPNRIVCVSCVVWQKRPPPREGLAYGGWTTGENPINSVMTTSLSNLLRFHYALTSSIIFNHHESSHDFSHSLPRPEHDPDHELDLKDLHVTCAAREGEGLRRGNQEGGSLLPALSNPNPITQSTPTASSTQASP